MQDFAEHFVREEYGVWRCVEPAEFTLRGWRLQVAVGTRLVRGTPFMGVDVALLLEEHYGRMRPSS